MVVQLRCVVLAVMLEMSAGALMPVCELAGQELGEVVAVVPQICLESSYSPWWSMTDGDG